jgi:hypothetical protein
VLIRAVRPSASGWALASDQPMADEEYEIVIVATPPDQAVPLLAQSSALQASGGQCAHAALLGRDAGLRL